MMGSGLLAEMKAKQERRAHKVRWYDLKSKHQGYKKEGKVRDRWETATRGKGLVPDLNLKGQDDHFDSPNYSVLYILQLQHLCWVLICEAFFPDSYKANSRSTYSILFELFYHITSQ